MGPTYALDMIWSESMGRYEWGMMNEKNHDLMEIVMRNEMVVDGYQVVEV